MRSLMLLCAFCLYAIVQGKLHYQEKIKNHYKCWTYMNCISDGPMARKMESCIDLTKPEDLKLVLAYIDENYYKFQNQTLPGLLSEYCHMDGDEQLDVYEKLMEATRSLEKVVSVYPDLEGFHSRTGDSFDCVLSYLEKHFPDDDCKID